MKRTIKVLYSVMHCDIYDKTLRCIIDIMHVEKEVMSHVTASRGTAKDCITKSHFHHCYHNHSHVVPNSKQTTRA